MAKQIFRSKIVLDDILPQIWRTIAVESDITFYQFYLIIQEAMGWTNSHLHEFNDGNFRIGDTSKEACEFGDPPQWEEKDKKISDNFSKDKTKLNYTYDFGDNWEHTIILEGNLKGVEKNFFSQKSQLLYTANTSLKTPY